jgi:hypothetical protein
MQSPDTPEHITTLIALLMIKTKRKKLNITKEDITLCGGKKVILEETPTGLTLTLIDDYEYYTG